MVEVKEEDKHELGSPFVRRMQSDRPSKGSKPLKLISSKEMHSFDHEVQKEDVKDAKSEEGREIIQMRKVKKASKSVEIINVLYNDNDVSLHNDKDKIDNNIDVNDDEITNRQKDDEGGGETGR